jgi:hypothetical protein
VSAAPGEAPAADGPQGRRGGRLERLQQIIPTVLILP